MRFNISVNKLVIVVELSEPDTVPVPIDTIFSILSSGYIYDQHVMCHKVLQNKRFYLIWYN